MKLPDHAPMMPEELAQRMADRRQKNRIATSARKATRRATAAAAAALAIGGPTAAQKLEQTASRTPEAVAPVAEKAKNVSDGIVEVLMDQENVEYKISANQSELARQVELQKAQHAVEAAAAKQDTSQSAD